MPQFCAGYRDLPKITKVIEMLKMGQAAEV
jgi:hypothetical protein